VVEFGDLLVLVAVRQAFGGLLILFARLPVITFFSMRVFHVENDRAVQM
jgi:hypothetical protein